MVKATTMPSKGWFDNTNKKQMVEWLLDHCSETFKVQQQLTSPIKVRCKPPCL